MPFKSNKQENYLRMHHPSIYNNWKKEGFLKGGKVEDYKKGGKVACFAQGGRNTDTVPAMLTPGEVVLNADQQESLGNMMAGGGKAKAEALFKHIGVPGYQDGKKIEYKDKMPHGMYAEMKRFTVPWDMPKKELMKKESLLLPRGNYSLLKKITKDVKLPKYKEKEEIELLDGYRGGGLVDKKDALMSYYMGGRVKKKKKKQKRGY